MSDLTPRQKGHFHHGHKLNGVASPTYYSWQSMLARCRYIARDVEKKHAGRGIVVCEQWKSFESFLADMGERPAGTTLDRRDNDKDYTPDNCRWSTPREQARNTRKSKLTFETATEVAVRRLRGEDASSIAADYGISESLPREIAKGRTWPDALARAKEILEKPHD